MGMPDLRPIFRVLLLTVAIMSGALSLLREFLQFVDPTKYPEKSLFYACLRVACILAFALLWWEEKKARVRTDAALNDTRPNLVLSLGNLIWIYDSAADKTVFFLSASVVNRGQPSVTLSWALTTKWGNP